MILLHFSLSSSASHFSLSSPKMSLSSSSEQMKGMAEMPKVMPLYSPYLFQEERGRRYLLFACFRSAGEWSEQTFLAKFHFALYCYFNQDVNLEPCPKSHKFASKAIVILCTTKILHIYGWALVGGRNLLKPICTEQKRNWCRGGGFHHHPSTQLSKTKLIVLVRWLRCKQKQRALH